MNDIFWLAVHKGFGQKHFRFSHPFVYVYIFILLFKHQYMYNVHKLWPENLILCMMKFWWWWLMILWSVCRVYLPSVGCMIHKASLFCCALAMIILCASMICHRKYFYSIFYAIPPIKPHCELLTMALHSHKPQPILLTCVLLLMEMNNVRLGFDDLKSCLSQVLNAFSYIAWWGAWIELKHWQQLDWIRWIGMHQLIWLLVKSDWYLKYWLTFKDLRF